jgi:hypothetical protein
MVCIAVSMQSIECLGSVVLPVEELEVRSKVVKPETVIAWNRKGFGLSLPSIMVRSRRSLSQAWKTFLRNQMTDLVTTDFFVAPTVSVPIVFRVSGSLSPCVAELDNLKKIKEESLLKDLTILGINEDEAADVGDSFLAKRGITWTNFHDNGEIWRALPSNSGIPYYVLIDANGQIAFSKPSASDLEIRDAIGILAAGPAKDEKPAP